MKDFIYVLNKKFGIKLVDIESQYYVDALRHNYMACNLWLFTDVFPNRFKKRSVFNTKLSPNIDITRKSYVSNGDIFIYTKRARYYDDVHPLEFKSTDYFFIYFSNKLYRITSKLSNVNNKCIRSDTGNSPISNTNEKYAKFMQTRYSDYWIPTMIKMFPNYSDNEFPDIFYNNWFYQNNIQEEEKSERDSRRQECYINSIPMNLELKKVHNHFIYKLEDIGPPIYHFTIKCQLFVPDVIIQLICKFAIDTTYCEIWYTTRYVDNLVPDSHPVSCDIVNINNGDIIISGNGRFGSPNKWDNHYMFIKDKTSPKGELFRVTKLKYLRKAMVRLIDKKLVSKNNWKPLKNNNWFKFLN